MEVRTYSNGTQQAAADGLKKGSSKKKLSTTKKSSKKSLGKQSSKVLERKETKDALDEVLENNQQFVPEVNQDIENMLKAMDPILVAKEKAANDIAFIFDPRKYDGKVHYSRDGNTVFYTQENEKKRAEMKLNMQIEDAINSVVDIYRFERDGTLTKAEYVKVNTCIARILRQDLKETMLAHLIEEDWKHDSKGKGFLDKKEVYDSLFELGDVWAPEIDEYQYVVFFERLAKLLKGEEELKNIPKNKICVAP